MALKLLSVNVERSKHLDTVTSFVIEQAADVVCMQELCERDITHYEDALQMECIYAPAGQHPEDPPRRADESVLVGEGFFTHPPVVSRSIDYYSGSEDGARTAPMHKIFWNLALVTADVEKDGEVFRIGTLHFTWTEKGAADERQRRDLDALLKTLETKGDFVLSGDFNAPRNGEIFQRIAAKYRDNIPPHYQTSLDPAYHRAPLEEQADKMVDGIFSTPDYVVSNVVLHKGISDHCAMTATIAHA